MNLLAMQNEANGIVQDDAYVDLIADYINESFLQAAGQVNLPDLKRLATISTQSGEMYNSLRGVTGGFNGRLTSIIGEYSEDIIVYNTLEDMVNEIQRQSRTFTDVGAVEMIALEGHVLWYFPIPAVPQSIAAIVFGNPPVLINETDSPDSFPDHVHKNIGVHGACYMAFDQIEDGLEGAKVNTLAHYALFQKGISDLHAWIAKNRKNYITSVMNV